MRTQSLKSAVLVAALALLVPACQPTDGGDGYYNYNDVAAVPAATTPTDANSFLFNMRFAIRKVIPAAGTAPMYSSFLYQQSGSGPINDPTAANAALTQFMADFKPGAGDQIATPNVSSGNPTHLTLTWVHGGTTTTVDFQMSL